MRTIFLRKATLIMTTIGYFLIWISNHKISVLFHSPLKVLFSFPSQYLFAIGLWLIFRISRNLPAILNSNLKEFDSLYRKVYTARADRCTGLSPSLLVLSNNTWPIERAQFLSNMLNYNSAPQYVVPRHHTSDSCQFKICSCVPISFAITNGITVVFFSLA